MAIKLIAIGNILMGGDGIGIRAAERISERLAQQNIEVIIGETDIDYCISEINEGDTVFFLDAACFGKEPGEITMMPLEGFKSLHTGLSQHGFSVLNLISIYNISIRGYIIAIETNEVYPCLELSKALYEKLDIISNNVLEAINRIQQRLCYSQ